MLSIVIEYSVEVAQRFLFRDLRVQQLLVEHLQLNAVYARQDLFVV